MFGRIIFFLLVFSSCSELFAQQATVIGHWNIRGLYDEESEQPFNQKLIFRKDSTFLLKEVNTPLAKGTFSLNPKANPAWITLTFIDEQSGQKTVVPAIYRFKGGNQLDLKLGTAPNKRPKSFVDAEDKVGKNRSFASLFRYYEEEEDEEIHGKLPINALIEQISGYWEVVNWVNRFDPPGKVRLFVYLGVDGEFEQFGGSGLTPGGGRQSGYYKLSDVEKDPHFIVIKTKDATSQKYFRVLGKNELKMENVVDKTLQEGFSDEQGFEGVDQQYLTLRMSMYKRVDKATVDAYLASQK